MAGGFLCDSAPPTEAASKAALRVYSKHVYSFMPGSVRIEFSFGSTGCVVYVLEWRSFRRRIPPGVLYCREVVRSYCRFAIARQDRESFQSSCAIVLIGNRSHTM